MPTNLVVKDLTKSFEGRTILDGVNFDMHEGESVAILGPSGSGKSTFLNILGTLEAADGGQVTLGDVDVTSLSGKALTEFRSQRVGIVFQEHHLLPQLTARENAILPALAQNRAGTVDALFAQLGIAERADDYPARLSGGERQRVALARALINHPALVLADEPTGNLDADTGRELIDLLLRNCREQGAMLLMVTHDQEQAKRLDRVLTLRNRSLEP